MAGTQKMTFQIGFSTDKSGLKELQSALNEISVLAKMPGKQMNVELQEAANMARQLSDILDKSYNKDLGTVNVSKFNQELLKSNINIKEVRENLMKAGAVGSTAYNTLASAILNANVQLKQSSKLLDSLATSMANTVKWGITSSIFNTMSDSLQKAFNYSVNLNTSLNDIRIVTEKSTEQMSAFAEEANEAAKILGASTLDYTQASLIYYQQGLSDEEVAARTDVTLKAANVTGQTGEEVSEQLTAIWNGYKVSADEAELYIDKVAAVAAATAADLEELSTGMGKVASAANTMGINVDQMNALLATAVSVTREAPETIGTSFRSIFSRMGQLKSDGTDEFGVTLGKVTTQLQSMGIEILDQQGNMRDMGVVITEVGEKWQGWTQAQKVAAAQAMAGTQQYSRLMAVFENWNMYEDALSTSQNALGTLNKQQDIFMESTEAHLQNLKTTWQDLYGGLINNEELNEGIDLLKNLVQVFDNFVDSFGGGIKSITAFGSVISNIFTKQISSSLAVSIENFKKYRENLDLLEMKSQVLQQDSANSNTPQGMAIQAGLETEMKYAQQIHQIRRGISSEQYNELSIIQQKIGQLEEQAVLIEQQAIETTNEVLKEEESLQLLREEKITMEEMQNLWAEKVSRQEDSIFLVNEAEKSIKDNFKWMQNEEDAEEEIADMKRTIRKLAKETNSESAKQLKQLIKSKDLTKLSVKDQDQILKLIKQAQVEEKKVLDILKEKADAVNKENSAREQAEGIRQKGGQVNVEFENTMEEATRAATVAQYVTTVTTALSSLTMTWSTINSLFQTWNDNTASLGDKISQTFMTVGMLIPTIISAYKGLQTITELYNVSKAKNIALSEIELILSKQNLTNMTQEQIMQQANNLAEQQGIALTQQEIAARLTKTGIITANATATGIDTAAKGADTAATVGLTAAQTALNASMLANPITWVIVGLVAAVGAIAAVVGAVNAHTKAVREETQAQIDRENEIQKTIDANNNLYESYLKSYEAYKNGTLSKEEMAKATDSLVELLGQEDIAIAKLTGDYDTLTKKILEAKKQNAEAGLASAQSELAGTSDLLISKAREGAGRKSGEKYKLGFETAVSYGDEKAIWEAMQGVGVTGLGGNIEWGSQEVTTDFNAKAIVQLYDELKEVQKEVADETSQYYMTASERAESETYKGISEWLSKMEEDVEKYKTALADVSKYSTQIQMINLDFTSITDLGDFTSKREQLINYLSTLEEFKNKSFNELTTLADTYISESSNAANDMLIKMHGVNALIEKFGENSRDAIEQAMQDLSSEDINILFSIGVDELNSLKELDTYIEKAKLKAKANKIELYIETSSDAINTLMSGENLNEEQLTELKKLEDEYYNLTGINEDLNTIQDKHSEEYLDKLIRIREALERQRVQIAKNNSNELIEDLQDIKITADDDQFQETMMDIADAEYEVIVEVKSDMQTDFDTITTQMENIQDMASKIGEGFIVAGTDLEELNETFPGILEGMTLLDDGSAKLVQGSIERELKAAKDRVIANREEIVKKLEFQRDEMLAKRDAALEIVKIAQKAQKGELKVEEASGLVKEQLKTIEMQNAETASDYEQDEQDEVSENAEISATSMATSYSSAYKKMAEDSAKWAKAARDNFFYAITGLGKANTGANISTAWSAETYDRDVTQAEKGELKSSEGVSEETNWEDVEKYYQNLANSYDAAANTAQGKIAEILARGIDFNKTTYNVSKGKGPEEKEKDTKDPDTWDDLPEELDLYHDINIEIKNIETELERLEKQQEKAFGKDLIENLNEQLKLLNSQVDNYNAKINIAAGEAVRLQASLMKKGITFDLNGNINNYEQAYLAQEQFVKDLITQYESMTAEEQESFKETVERAEESFDKFKEDIERYDELMSDIIPGLQDDIQEALDQQIEISVEKFNMEIETRLDMSQAERDWNEFKKKVIDNIDDDDILGNAKANLEDFSSYYKDNFEGVIQVNTDHVNDILFELDEMDRGLASKYYGDNRTKALEDLKTYYTQLMDDLTAVEELSEEIRQSYLDMMDEAQEKFDEQISTYEQITDLIDHDIKLIELLNGEKSYAEFGEYYNKLEANNNKQLDFQRQQVEFWKAQMDSAEEGSERWEKAKENWTAAVTDWRSLVNESIENLQDKYLNTISEIFERLNNEVTNGLGLEYVNEEWNLINRNAEEYLDTINAMYGIQELSNKYLDAIDQTDNISAQKELNKLMEQEIAALEEKDKLTQYDIDRANKKYEIALKQIALEEAQQNKTSMRLKRDSQGNYSYAFVADEDAVGKAEDELASAQNDLYNFDKENYINNLDELYAAYEEYQEKMFEAAQINDPDERAQKELLINEQYGELINGLVEQNQTIRSNLHESAFDELARLYNTDVENYRRMSEEEKNILLNEMIPQWTSGVQQMADTFAGEGGLGEVCKESLAEISQATEDYKTDLEEVEDAAGLTFEEIVSGTDDAIIETEDLLEVNDELIEQYEDELDAIDAVIDELDKLIDKFEEAKQAAIEASEAAYEYVQSADDDMANEAFEDRDYSEDMTRAIVSGYSTDDKHYQSLSKRRDKKIAESDVQTDVTSSRLRKLFDAYRAGDSKAQTVVMAVYNGEADYTDKFLDKYGFKTGGYTGNWTGETGRLALLHQKELVLNAEDTQNVLGAIKILRNITDLIGDSVIRKAAAMSGNITTPQGGNITNETLEQDVHIDAHFPNVTNSREIENALDNLMNKASQRALRKR